MDDDEKAFRARREKELAENEQFFSRQWRVIDDLQHLKKTLRDEHYAISPAISGLDIEGVLSGGATYEMIAAMFQVAVEEVEALYLHTRSARAQVLLKGREMLKDFGTYDYLEEYYTLGTFPEFSESYWDQKELYQAQKRTLNIFHRRRR